MLESAPRSYQRFFAELKRRYVFRVMAVYGIAGFVILQIVDLAVPVVLVELLPEAFLEGRRAPVAMVATLTLIGMMLFQRML